MSDDYWTKCNHCGHPKLRSARGGCPFGHLAGFSGLGPIPEVGSRVMVGVRRRVGPDGAARVRVEPDTLPATIEDVHPKRPMALVAPDGWEHMIWVGIEEFVA